MAGAQPRLGQVRPGLDESFFEVTDFFFEPFLRSLGLGLGGFPGCASSRVGD